MKTRSKKSQSLTNLTLATSKTLRKSLKPVKRTHSFKPFSSLLGKPQLKELSKDGIINLNSGGSRVTRRRSRGVESAGNKEQVVTSDGQGLSLCLGYPVYELDLREREVKICIFSLQRNRKLLEDVITPLESLTNNANGEYMASTTAVSHIYILHQ